MRIRLSFSILIDLDLLSIMHVPEFNFKGWMKDSLRTYAGTGKTRKVPLPASVPADMTLQNIKLSITLDKSKDAAVEKWLNTLKNKQRSGAIKSVLRCSLEEPCLFAHDEAYPAIFLVSSSQNTHTTANETGYEAPVKQNEITSAAPPSKLTSKPISEPLPAQLPEIENDDDDDFDIFNMSMEIQE
ncbi:MAG: hypothetical protein LBI03_07525 [Clostridiales bacterium]|jgi:hypothetical protein|nr:hypothetical protein [Clostridiales bacterium]